MVISPQYTYKFIYSENYLLRQMEFLCHLEYHLSAISVQLKKDCYHNMTSLEAFFSHKVIIFYIIALLFKFMYTWNSKIDPLIYLIYSNCLEWEPQILNCRYHHSKCDLTYAKFIQWWQTKASERIIVLPQSSLYISDSVPKV